MDRDAIVEACRREPFVSLDAADLAMFLEYCEIVRETDTCMSGLIRILRCDDFFLVQEQTPQGEVLLRRFATENQAAELVDDRLATYERMWDGCGCKIHYHKV